MSKEKTHSDISSNKHILAKWIASGWLLFFATLALTWWLLPNDMTSEVTSFAARMTFAFSHIFFASLILFIGFLAVGATRWQIETKDVFASPAASGNKTASINIHNQVHAQFLSNSSEQFIMFSAAIIAATMFLESSYLSIITLMTIMWVFGRLFFWGGYWYTAYHNLPTYPRAVGLGMGLLSTLVLICIAAIGISLHYPSFAFLTETQALITHDKSFAFAGFIIEPQGNINGSNILPIVLFSAIAIITAILAFLPKLAPPVIPMAAICVFGWAWLIFSGVIPIRF